MGLVSNTPLPLLPPGVLFKGVFLTPPGGDYVGWYTSGGFIANFTRQAAAAKALGFNAASWFRGAECVGSGGGQLPLAAWLALGKGALDILTSMGMYALPYGSASVSQYAANGTTVGAVATAVAADAPLCSGYPNVIGYCCTDESIGASALSIYDAAKPDLPINFPLTYTANPINAAPNEFDYASNPSSLDTYVRGCDFLNFNPNRGSISAGTAYASTSLDSLYAAYPDHEIAMGASTAQNDNTGFATVFNSLVPFLGTKGVRMHNVFLLEDYDATPLGLYSGPAPTGPRAPRISASQTAFGNSPIVPATRTSRGSPVKNQYLVEGYS